MKTLFILLAFCITPFITITPQIIHVPQDQPGIQQAIDVALDHDTILVDQGEYFENINFSGKNLVLCSHWVLTNDSADIINTIINGSNPVYPDTGSCVLMVSGEDSTAVIQGFTITGGTGTRWEDEHGANSWYTEGGGILIQYSAPTIKNNIITGNEAINVPPGTVSAGGGAIRCGDGNPHIYNNIISNNQGRYGGGIVLNYSGADIRNNIISGNSGGEDFGGGGLWFLSNGAMPTFLENNTVVNNSSAQGGGGIRLWSSSAILTNNIFWGNTGASTPQIQGNTGGISYCCVEGGLTGEGNFGNDPGFLNSSFILMDGSPCIDAGRPDASYNDPEDPENPGNALFPAKGTLHADVGAFGGPGCLPISDPVTGIEHLPKKQDIVNVHLYPNPASTVVNIRIETQQPSAIAIQLCDTGARLVKELDNQLINGEVDFQTDISDIKPGTYFIRLITSRESKVVKFIKESPSQ